MNHAGNLEGQDMALKMWNDPDWTKHLTKTLHVGTVDMDQEPGEVYKPWHILLTQDPDCLAANPLKHELPPGTSLLLTADDAVALVWHLVSTEQVWLTQKGAVDGKVADRKKFLVHLKKRHEAALQNRRVAAHKRRAAKAGKTPTRHRKVRV
jgi:hypothetical protein